MKGENFCVTCIFKEVCFLLYLLLDFSNREELFQDILIGRKIV